jgi:predicted dehydrogenase
MSRTTNNQSMIMSHHTDTVGGATRREFLRKTATATAAVAATGLLRPRVFGQAPSAGVTGANERITVGIIGVGNGIGKNHLEGIVANGSANNTKVIAASDVFNSRRDWAKAKAGISESDLYDDYRKMLERKDLNAVLIATHDPLHAQMTIDAVQAGKHVYCEKPLTRYLDEAFRVYDVVKKSGLVFQVGAQGSSAAAWHEAAKLIRNGDIGEPVWGQGFYNRNNPKGEWNYTIESGAEAANIEWKRWLGPVSDRPFSADSFYRWRKYYPFCAGLLGDLVPHRLIPLMLATGNPQFPVRVACVGVSPVGTDKNTPGTPKRDVPEHVQLEAEFPGQFMLTVGASTVNAKSPGFVIYGHKATLEIGNMGEKLKLVPEREFSDEIDPLDRTNLQPSEDIRIHEKNWFDCIRSGKTPNGNIDLAVRAQTVISLAEMSDRLKITCLFDEKTRKITTGDGKEIPAITYGSIPGQS